MISMLHLRHALLATLVGVALGASLLATASDSAASRSIESAPAARVIPPPPGYVFPNVEYVYSVQWGLFRAGTSTVRLHHSDDGVRVTATADSAGMPDKFFKVHDTFNADVNPRTLCTSQITKHNEEGPRQRDITIVLDYAHAKSKADFKDLKTSESKHAEADIPGCVTDVISGFFYVASLPLAPGYSETFPVNDNGRMTDAKFEVEGREHIKVSAGEFETLRVKVEPVAGAMKGKGTLWVWFTDDARHAPVQMKSKLGFATLVFQLQKMNARSDR
jgi:Protein of unknown function (DUF3108)